MRWVRALIRALKHLRDLWYQHVVWRRYKIGRGFHCGRGVFIWGRTRVEIGENFYIGKYSVIETDCVIGNDVIVANHVGIVGRYDHCYEEVGVPVRRARSIRDKDYDWRGVDSLTRIGNDVWLGYGSIIMGGVCIADGTIVGAGSVVTRDTEPYCIYAGVPARKIKPRFAKAEDLAEHQRRLAQGK